MWFSLIMYMLPTVSALRNASPVRPSYSWLASSGSQLPLVVLDLQHGTPLNDGGNCNTSAGGMPVVQTTATSYDLYTQWFKTISTGFPSSMNAYFDRRIRQYALLPCDTHLSPTEIRIWHKDLDLLMTPALSRGRFRG